MLELRATFYGKVQGVGFRMATLKLARGLDLKGYVKNQTDGTVELLAQGEKKQLDQLLEGLEQAFGSRWIDRVKCDFQSPQRHYDDFAVSS